MGDERIETEVSHDERFDQLVPAWMFVLRSPLAKAVVSIAVPLLFALPLLVAERPADLRLGPFLAISIVAVAAVAGWTGSAGASAIVVGLYWWAGTAPAYSFRLEDRAEIVTVCSMATFGIGVTLLARRVQASVTDVRALDAERQMFASRDRELRDEAERTAAQLRAVQALSLALADAMSMVEVAEVTLDGIDTPAFPTTASVAIVDGEHHLRVLAARNAEPGSIRALERVDLRSSSWLGEVLAGTPAYVDDRDQFAEEHPEARVLFLYPSGSWAVVPFRSEHAVGLLSVHYLAPQPLSTHSLYFSLVAELLATSLQRAHALEQQQEQLDVLRRAYAERDRIARTLSTTLLPPKLPALPGFSLSGWLAPAHDGEVAGDFYDVFAVNDGWVAILGDVCGKGAEAAAVTSLARYAARATALDQPDPAHIVAVADHTLLEDPSDLFCTMAVVRYGATSGEIEVTLAGHPQARLLTKGEVRTLGSYGTPLGVAGGTIRVDRQPFAPGDVLVLFSDGLVERDPTFGEHELDATLTDWAGLSADAVAAALQDLASNASPKRDDDVAILVIGRQPSAPGTGKTSMPAPSAAVRASDE